FHVTPTIENGVSEVTSRTGPPPEAMSVSTPTAGGAPARGTSVSAVGRALPAVVAISSPDWTTWSAPYTARGVTTDAATATARARVRRRPLTYRGRRRVLKGFSRSDVCVTRVLTRGAQLPGGHA